ncbi:MAG TPA: SDR family NAD(P)-dependent oxidoreductase [bacterium]|nr:SDR family NAD(P)-dependent oxidoreductase [bacterium]
MGRLAGRVAIVTGAGRGLGRAHALFLSEQGAAVVVNDLGGGVSGDAGTEVSPAEQVVAEIRAHGGKAVASAHDVSDWGQANELIDLAVEAFGDLHVLVNNAGIIRDRTLANLEEQDWDLVIKVHLKGHAAPTRHALAYWRAQAKAGREVKASVVHTTSIAGFVGSFGQANYSVAKAGLIALSKVVALEGTKYGVRSNAVSPSARTRITLTIPGAEGRLKAPEDPGAFDFYAPENVSPLIGWLAEENCPANDQIFHIAGNRLYIVAIPQIVHVLEYDGRWTLEALDRQVPQRLVEPLTIDVFLRPPSTPTDAARPR